ncbi:MAG: DMT family transporter [Burkholderiaceae bacterium]|nr:DMT family transporter [Burkholderiaceae bacterium]
MPRHLKGILGLLIVTMVWGTTFPAMKDLSQHFSASWILFLRFAIGGLVLIPFLLRAKKADWLGGGMLGALLFVAAMFQFSGLVLTSSNRNAFVTGLNVLIVPLLGLAAGKLPEKRILVAIALAIVGLFALCWDGAAWGEGDNLALMGAFCFGAYVKMLEVTSRRASSLMAMTTVQILAVALCALLWLMFRELPAHPFFWDEFLAAGRASFFNLAYLSLVATAAIISLQTWGQHHASANEAAVIYAFEPGCAAIAAYFWLGESMGLRGLVGAALLIGGMIVSQWTPENKPQAPQASGNAPEGTPG